MKKCSGASSWMSRFAFGTLGCACFGNQPVGRVPGTGCSLSGQMRVALLAPGAGSRLGISGIAQLLRQDGDGKS